MIQYPMPCPTPGVEACELLLLLARREARLMSMADGAMTQDALERWEERLPAAQLLALDTWDRLIRHERSMLAQKSREDGL